MLALRSAPVAIRLVLAALTLLFAVYAAEIVFAFLPAAVGDPFMKYVSNLIFVGAAALCAARGLRGPGERGAWLLMGLGVLAWGLGLLYYTLRPVGPRDDPGPVAGRRRLPAHLPARLRGARAALPLAHPRPQRSALDRRRHRRARGRRDRRRGRVRRGARVGRGGGPLRRHQPQLSARGRRDARARRRGAGDDRLAQGGRVGVDRRRAGDVRRLGQPLLLRHRARHLRGGRDLRRRLARRGAAPRLRRLDAGVARCGRVRPESGARSCSRSSSRRRRSGC